MGQTTPDRTIYCRAVQYAASILDLVGDQDLSVLFSFTRSHFHVEAGPPARLVRFLHELMPEKRLAELYIAIGFHKHGKTELYRDLLRHLRTTDDRFELARGTPGLVMVVFTMPGFDVVVCAGNVLTFVEEMILHEEMALQKAPPMLNILGVGRVFLNAVNQHDLPVVQGAILYFTLAVMIVNLLVDLLVAWLDPRIRLA